MSGGRLFQSRLPAAVKARSPTVTSLVVGMMTSWRYTDIKNFFCLRYGTSFSLPFSELSLVGLALDMVD